MWAEVNLPVARDVAQLVSAFRNEGDSSAAKSAELVLQLLEYADAPFSRDHFTPGHITCTGLVLHPERDAFLLVLHRRLDRWLLPGGHVEEKDAEIWDTARREVVEETGASLIADPAPSLVGIDVHGIPPKRREPYHLHHDLIYLFRAASDEVVPTEEARDVAWCDPAGWNAYGLPLSIQLSFRRALSMGG